MGRVDAPCGRDVLEVGLTGNAGSGKSTVAAFWSQRGARVIDADELAREVVGSDRELRRRLAIEFGDDVLEPSASAETGAVRRAELARRAFASPERTLALNRLVHPPLLDLLERRIAEARRDLTPGPAPGPAPRGIGRSISGEGQSVSIPDGAATAEAGSPGHAQVLVVDAALIFETGLEDRFDWIVLVTAPEAVRLERLRRRGLERATLRGLTASQIPDERKTPRADLVLVNDGARKVLRERALDALARIVSCAPPRRGPAAARAARPSAPSTT